MNTDDVDLRILHLNIRSLSSSIDLFTTFLSELKYNFDIMCLTESWLSDSTIQLYHLSGYAAFHSLRPNNQHGGGISVYVSDSFEANVLSVQSVCAAQIETLFLELYHGYSKETFILGTVYRPPKGDSVMFTDALCTFLSELADRRAHDIILCGDFNIDLFKIETHAPTLEFLNRMHGMSFMPVISKPTRVTNTSATLIDNIFVSTPSLYTSGIFNNDISDHFPIFIIINNYIQHQESGPVDKKVFRFRAINQYSLAAMREKTFGTGLWSIFRCR